MACTSYSSGTSAQVNIALGTVSTTPCAQTLQQMAQAIVDALTLTLPSNFATFNIGSDTPTAANQDKLWFKTDASCNPLGWFIYFGGSWVKAIPHGVAPGIIVPYTNSTFDASNHAINAAIISFLDVYEASYPGGGSTTLYTNPFWRVCDGTNSTPDLRGRAIVGAGQGASLTNRLPTATGGIESVTLSTNELPPIPVGGDGTGGIRQGSSTQAATVVGGGVAHQNMPPFYNLYWIMRTTRTI